MFSNKIWINFTHRAPNGSGQTGLSHRSSRVGSGQVNWLTRVESSQLIWHSGWVDSFDNLTWPDPGWPDSTRKSFPFLDKMLHKQFFLVNDWFWLRSVTVLMILIRLSTISLCVTLVSFFGNRLDSTRNSARLDLTRPELSYKFWPELTQLDSTRFDPS